MISERPAGGDVRPGGRRRQGAGRVLFVGRAEPREGLGVLLGRPSRSCASGCRTTADARRRPAPRGPQVLGTDRVGSGPAGRPHGRRGARWGDDEGRRSRSWGGDRLNPSARPRASASCSPEGMAAGVPGVVASNLPRGYRAVLRDGEAGRLTPPGDPVALADAVYDLLQTRRAAAAQGRGHRRRRGPLVGADHRPHRGGLRGRARGCAYAACKGSRADRTPTARWSSTRSGRAAVADSVRRAAQTHAAGTD